jgi:hypothetical protein
MTDVKFVMNCELDRVNLRMVLRNLPSTRWGLSRCTRFEQNIA